MQHIGYFLRNYNCIVFNFCLTGKGLQFLKPFFILKSLAFVLKNKIIFWKM